MEKIVCQNHELELEIPTTDIEFLKGNLHENVIQVQLHHKEFPSCRFQEVKKEL